MTGIHAVSRRRSAWLVAAILLVAPVALAQGDPSGHWEGTVAVGGQHIGLTLDLARNAKSEWEASMGVPSENATGLVVRNVKVYGSSVSFVAVELMMFKFDLTLDVSGTMKGAITTQQEPIEVEFKRTGEANIERIPASPAVSKELEGDWEATPAGAGASFPLTFHFKNQPDHTVLATVDSPTRNAMAIPLNDLKQSGLYVEFGMKVANASFQGTLNQEGSELSGKFTHDGEGTPLVLKKK